MMVLHLETGQIFIIPGPLSIILTQESFAPIGQIPVQTIWSAN